jgi:hypothetical protein
MSLYKENKFKDILKNKIVWYVLIGIIIIIILIFLISKINFSNIFEKENISVNFSQNPLVLSEKNNTLMDITLINNTEKDLENIEVKIKDVEDSFLIYCPDSKTDDLTRVVISKLAKGNDRIVTCNIRYDMTKDLFEGTYSFDIDYYIENSIFTKRADLKVKR